MRTAIVIPTLDEAPSLAACLAAARDGSDEIVVADGGSADGTRELAASLGARVVTSPPGRGVQLNRGAAAADAELLLFLHADTVLGSGAVAAARSAVRSGAVGGGFRVRFDSPRQVFRLGERIVDLRTRATRLPLGDQAQFATRDAFAALGGFREWPILEDLDFALRLRHHGRVAILGPPVVTAARRFVQRGIARTVATNWLIWALYAGGVPPARLARLYRHVR